MTNFDPTTNRIQFGLLTPEEQKVLREWPHAWEWLWSGGQGPAEWETTSDPLWVRRTVYRGKPAPVTTSVWVNFYDHQLLGGPCKSRQEADKAQGINRLAVLRIDTCNGVSKVTVEES